MSEPQITAAVRAAANDVCNEELIACGQCLGDECVAVIIDRHMALEREAVGKRLEAADALANTAEALIKNICSIDQLEESLHTYRKATNEH
jgi:hypothetical protein